MTLQRPTILQIIPRLDTGGAELSTIEVAEAVVRSGGRALVATAGGRMLDRLRATGAELAELPVATKNPLVMAHNVQRLSRIIRSEHVDLVHARSRAPAWSAWAAAKKEGSPFVTTYHGAYAERGRLKHLYNSVMVRGDLVIANSHYTSDLIKRRYGTPPERIRVIHRGVDPAVFSSGTVTADRIESLRQRWRVGPQQRIILQAARLTAWKGQHVLIEAARLLQSSGRLADAVVVLAGDAQGRAEYHRGLEQQVATAGLQGHMRLVGHVDDIAAAFATAHVAVIASIEPEAFGRTAVEAELLGCPVIATRIGAPAETVLAEPAVERERITGWLVPPGDAASLADRLFEALTFDMQERAAMGLRARAHVLANFTLDQMKRETMKVYDQLIGSRLADGEPRDFRIS